MIVNFAIWLQNTALFSYIRYAAYGYLSLLTAHVILITLFGAMVTATNLRLLGIGFRKHSISDLVDQLRTPKRIGLILVVTCGILLYGSKAEEYYCNPFFRVKLSLLALIAIHALAFRKSVYASAAELDRAAAIPGRAKLAAWLSLFLWLSVLCAGRAIGYISPADSPHHYAFVTLPPSGR